MSIQRFSLPNKEISIVIPIVSYVPIVVTFFHHIRHTRTQ